MQMIRRWLFPMCVTGLVTFACHAPIAVAGAFTFDWQSIAADLNFQDDVAGVELFYPDIDSNQYPFTTIRGGAGQGTSLTGLPVTLAAVGGDASKISFDFGSMSESPLGPAVMDLTGYDSGAGTLLAIQEFSAVVDVPITFYIDGAPVVAGAINNIHVFTPPSLTSTATIDFQLVSSLGGDSSVYDEWYSVLGDGVWSLELSNFHFDGITDLADGALFAATGELTFDSVDVVPEPSTMALLLTGALGFIGFGYRRRRAKRLAA